MGVVKYTGPMASFHCPTNAEIRSLKVHFSPKQEGSGDPSPENVRSIVGWDGINTYRKGKNLFNWNVEQGHASPITSDRATARSYPLNTYIIGMSASNYYRDNYTNWVLEPSISNGIISFSSGGANGYGIGYPLKLMPNYTYFLSGETTNNGLAGAIYYDKDGTLISAQGNRLNNTITIPDNTVTTMIIFYANAANTSYTFSNIQLELGSTATLYEPYQGSTINYEFGVLGKNKFNYSTANIIDKKRRDDTGAIVSDATGSYCQTLIPVSPNATYTLSGYPVNNNSKRIYYIDAEENFIERTAAFGSSSSYTFITPNNCYYVQIQNREVGENASWETLQLELGSTATEYEPYDPNHTVYGGWVDLITGEVQEEYCGYILNGTESRWSLDGSEDIRRRVYHDTVRLNGVAKPKGKLYCSYCSTRSSSIWYGWISSGGSSTSCYILFYIPSTLDTVDKWKEYLSENPLDIVYELATPNTYHLAPTQLQTFLGQNNVWSNADYVEVEYDLHETQTILARSKQFIMANQPHVVKPAAAPLQNFVTDMAAPLKECKVYFNPVQDTSNGAPSPDNICPISGWNQIQIGLPAEYQAVEYIGAEGASPYIDTGIDLTGELQAEIHYYNDKKEAFLFGSRKSTSGPYCNFNIDSDGKKCRFDYSTRSMSGLGGFRDGSHDGEYLFTFKNRVATLTGLSLNLNMTRNEYTHDNTLSLYTDYPVLLFGVRTGTNLSLGSTSGSLRIYSAKFWLGGTYANNAITGAELVRNFVPCVRKTDNVAGMYDTVTETFFTSKNSATFTAGPVVGDLSMLVDWTNTVYGGYVDLVTGEVWETWGLKDLGMVNWTNYSNRAGVFYTAAMNDFSSTSKLGVLCNKYVSTHDNVTVQADKTIGDAYQLRARSFAIYDTDYVNATVTEFKTAMSGVIAVYPLATPTLITTLTPTQLKTLRGTNNIWSNANGNIELSYWKH